MVHFSTLFSLKVYSVVVFRSAQCSISKCDKSCCFIFELSNIGVILMMDYHDNINE